MKSYIDRKIILLLTVAVLAFGGFRVVKSAFNEQINYQGKLTDTGGVAVPDASYNLRFRLCTASDCSAGVVWTETLCYSPDSGSTCDGTGTDQRVSVASGLFSILLGNVSSLSSVDFNQTLYLEVQVGGSGATPSWETLIPRKKLGAVPAAMEAKKLGGATWASPSAIGSTTPNSGAFTGLTSSGNSNLASTAGSTFAFGNTTGAATLQSGGASSWTNTAGTLGLTSTGALNLSAGAASTVTLANIANALNFDSDTLTVDALNNRVGIGTAAPGYNFTVNAGGAAGAMQIINNNTGSSTSDGFVIDLETNNDAYVIQRENSDLYFRTNNTNRMMIDNGGDVGIGTVAPGAKLDISGHTRTSSISIQGGGTYEAGSVYSDVNWGMLFRAKQASPVVAEFSFAKSDDTKLLTILSSGNVGISTTGPDRKLDVLDATNPQVRLTQADGTTYVDLQVDSSGDLLMNVDGASNQLVLDNGGNVGIGTAAPGAKLNISTNTQEAAVRIQSTDTGGRIYGLGTTAGAHGFGQGTFFLFDYTASATRLFVNSSGNVGINTIGPDRRFDVLDASNPQMRLTQTDGTTYADMQVDSNGDFMMNVDGRTNQLVLDDGGNVGIGTAAPGQLLVVQKDQNAGTVVDFKNATAGTGAYEYLRLTEDDVNKTLGVFHLNTSYTTNGVLTANTGYIDSFDSGGLGIGARNASGIIKFYTAGYAANNERMRIDSSGNVGIGTTSPISKSHISLDGTSPNAGLYAGAEAQTLTGNTGTYARIIGASDTANASPALVFTRAKGTVASPTIVSSGDDLGYIVAQGFDGSSRRNAAQVLLSVDGTPGSSDMPGRIAFLTTPDGSSTLTERMRIDNTGNVGIGTTIPTGKLTVVQGTTGVGTVSNSAGGTTVTGVGTQFLNTFKVGDTITINGETVAISAIASDTSMTTAAITNANSGVAYTLVGGTRMVVQGNGNVGIGTATPLGALSIKTRTIFNEASNYALYGYNFYYDGVSWTRVNTSEAGVNFHFSPTTSTEFRFNRIEADGTNTRNLAVLGSGTSYIAEGNFGVGTVSPGTKFHVQKGVAGTAPAWQAPDVAIFENTAGTNVALQLFSSNAAASNLAFSDTDARNVGVISYNHADDSMAFWANNGERMRIISSGNVGIGDTTPASMLTVGNGDLFQVNSSGAIAAATGIDSSGNIDLSSLSAGGLVQAAAGTGRLSVATGGTDFENPLTFNNGLTRTANTVKLGGTLTANTDVPLGGFNLTFSGTGLVGIGTSAPGAKLTVNDNSSNPPTPASATILHVVGSDASNSRILLDTFATTPNFTFRQANGTAASPTATLQNNMIGALSGFGYGATGYSSTARAQILYYGAENWTDIAQSTYMTFRTTPLGSTSIAERMRIDSAGNVGINTTGPDRRFDVLDATNPQMRLTQTDGTTYADMQVDSNGDLIMNVDGRTNQLVLDDGGNVGIGTAAPTANLNIVGASTGYNLVGIQIENTSTGVAGLNFKADNHQYNFGAQGSGSSNPVYTGKFSIYDATAGAHRLNMDTNGNIGINANPLPAAKLDVLGTFSATTAGSTYTASKSTTTITATVGTFSASDVGRFFVWTDGTVDLITGYTDATHVTVSASATISSQAGYTRVANFYVNSSGYVGVGTVTPSTVIDVSNNINNLSAVKLTNTSVGSSAQTVFQATTDEGSVYFGASNSGYTTPKALVWSAIPNRDLVFGVNSSEKARITSAGNVGINTTGPDRKLDVLDATNPQMRLTQTDGTTYADMQVDSNGDLIMNVDGRTNQLVLDDGGNVGIGTTTPAYLLDAIKNQDGNTTMSVKNSTAGTSAQANVSVRNDGNLLNEIGIFSSATTAYGSISTNESYLYTNTAGLSIMVNNASGTIKFATGGSSEKMRIDNAGKVGIGTTSPQYTLDVQGDISSSTAVRDAISWVQNQGGIEKLKLAYNNGSFGSGATPGNITMQADHFSFFDTTSVNANSKGFTGAIFDGRYIYFVPYTNGSSFGQVTRYDTTASFSTAGSWSVFDTTTVNANSKGFIGGVFDGRYIYLVPFLKDGLSHGQVTRYDTTASFTAAGSWSVFDTATVNANSKGFTSGVFDGRYVYLVPYSNGSQFGQVTRYDTTASFTAAGSWSVFDTTTVNANSKGFLGGVFDGRYVYFVPFNNGSPFGQVTRYDTTASFTAAGSWGVFDTTTVNANSKGFAGGVFDGRYVYLVPYSNGSQFGQVTRYDTTASFTAAGSWSVFDTTTVNANSKGFLGGVFDGRYLYLVPDTNGAAFGQVTRYDSTGAFTTANSWSVFDTATVNANSKGFYGAAFDGRYIYLVPYDNGAKFGQVTRMFAWAGGIDSTTSLNKIARGGDLYIDSAGNVGIGTTSPGAKLDVSASSAVGVRSLSTATLGASSGGGVLLATTSVPTAADQRLGTFVAGGITTGTTYSYPARMNAYSSQAWSATASGAYLTFLTTPNDSTTLAERMRITDAGKIGIGITDPGNSKVLILAGDSGDMTLTLQENAAANNARFDLRRSQGSSSTPTIVSSGDYAGAVRFSGYDGANYLVSSTIRGEIDGTPGTNDMPGRLVFLTTADGASAATERMRIDNAGYVGIGTTAPTRRLHLENLTAGTNSVSSTFLLNTRSTGDMTDGFGGGMLFGINDDTLSGENLIATIYGLRSGADNSGSLTFNTYNSGTRSEWMRINNAGNVGIGTTSPAYKLDIQKDGDNAIVFTTAYGATMAGSFYGASARGTQASPSASQLNDYLGVFGAKGYGATAFPTWSKAAIFMNAAENWTDAAQGTYMTFNTTATGGTTRTEKMRIDASGNVGIGATSISQLGAGGTPTVLQVHSAGSFGFLGLSTGLTASSSFTGALTFGTTGTSSSEKRSALIASSLTAESSTNVSGDLQFYTNNAGSITQKMVILASGNVGIGATNPTSLLYVQKDQNAGTWTTLRNATSDTGAYEILRLTEDDGNKSLDIFHLNTSFTTSGILTANTSYIDSIDSGGLVVGTRNASGIVKFFTGGLALNNERMRIDSVGNVGIGSTNPGAKLEIEGAAAAGGTAFLLIDDTTSGGGTPIIQFSSNSENGYVFSGQGLSDSRQDMFGVQSDHAAGLFLGTNNPSGIIKFASGALSERMRINSTGNVGIGTTNPAANLTVAQGTSGVGTVSNSAGGTTVTGVGTQFLNTFKVGDTITIGGQTVAISAIASDTSMTTAAITNANSGVAYTLAGGTRMVVQGNGNVGIGTATPSEELHVYGGSTISKALIGSSQGSLDFLGLTLSGNGYNDISSNAYFSTSNGWHRRNDSNEAWIISQISTPDNTGSWAIARAAAGTGEMTVLDWPFWIDSYGKVGIGTNTPSEELTIRQDLASSTPRNLLGIYDGANNTTLAINDGGQTTFKPSSFDKVYTFDGVSTYADNTTEAKTSGGTAFNILSSEASSNDEFYFGLDHPYNTVYFDIATAGAGVTLSAQYWNGAWTALTITDNTTNLTVDGTVTFTAPSDWATTSVNSTTKYWVRLRSPSTNITTAPTANSVSPTTGSRFYAYAQAGDTNPALYVNDKGNVGIGTASPGTELYAWGAGRTIESIKSSASDGGALEMYTSASDASGNYPGQVVFGATAQSGSDKRTALIASQIVGATATNRGGNLEFYTKANGGSLGLNMIIDNAGNVGIGTATPLAQMDINNDLHVAANSSAWNSVAGKGLYMRYSTSGGQDSAYIQSSDRTGGVTYYPLNFRASQFVFTTGSVGIGDATPDYALDVWGTICQDTDSNDTCDGTVTSDLRLKTNIELISSPLEKIKKLRGVTFEWDETNPATEHLGRGITQIGLIAQDVEEVFPSLVYEDMLGYKMIDYQKLTAVNLEAIKEQQKQIEELKLAVNSSGNITDSNGEAIIASLGESQSFKDLVASTVRDALASLSGTIATAGEWTFGKITTKELCVDDVCVNKSQLQELLNKNQAGSQENIPAGNDQIINSGDNVQNASEYYENN